jgi:hypothetical protein
MVLYLSIKKNKIIFILGKMITWNKTVPLITAGFLSFVGVRRKNKVIKVEGQLWKWKGGERGKINRSGEYDQSTLYE